MKLDLRVVEQQLDERGYSKDVRDAIRNSRICIVDDLIDDLKGLTDSLRAEGFTNLVELSRISSVEDLLSMNCDLVILDLSGIANDISVDDGFGVLAALKSARPALPVLVVTGSTTPPRHVSTASRADLIRSKPVKALELVGDVETLLRPYKDQYWAALEVLRELRRLDADLAGRLAFQDRLILWWRRRQISSRLANQSGDTVSAIISVAKLVSGGLSEAAKLVDIARSFTKQ